MIIKGKKKDLLHKNQIRIDNNYINDNDDALGQW